MEPGFIEPGEDLVRFRAAVYQVADRKKPIAGRVEALQLEAGSATWAEGQVDQHSGQCNPISASHAAEGVTAGIDLDQSLAAQRRAVWASGKAPRCVDQAVRLFSFRCTESSRYRVSGQ
jgi:hypothetical protein